MYVCTLHIVLFPFVSDPMQCRYVTILPAGGRADVFAYVRPTATTSM